MGNRQRIELYVPRDQLSVRRVQQVVEALVTVGFEVLYQSYRPTSAVLAEYEQSGTTSFTLGSPVVRLHSQDEQLSYGAFSLSVTKYPPEPHVLHCEEPQAPLPVGEPLAQVRLEPWWSWIRYDRFFHFWLAWGRLLAELLPVWYGWIDDEEGFGMCGSGYQKSPARIGALEPQQVEWCTILGQSYVEQLGLEHLLATPTWRVDVLANGAVAVTLGPDPFALDVPHVVPVAEHLGWSADGVIRQAARFGGTLRLPR